MAGSPRNVATRVDAQLLQTFGHEGRIPPLPIDYRVDPQAAPNWGLSATSGDLPLGAHIRRLRRAYDSWSTAYSQSLPTRSSSTLRRAGRATLPGPPIYPSYPPPYPLPLRGIQIQIRVVDPRNEHIKVLTIRQDFSDKL